MKNEVIVEALTLKTHPSTRYLQLQKNRQHKIPAFTNETTNKTTDLTQDQVVEFVKEIDLTFGSLVVAGVNDDEINDSLSRLNERKDAGVRALIQILTNTPKDDEVRGRISMIDYLLYRSRWDDLTRSEILRLGTSEVPETIPSKIRGAIIVERSEMIGRLASFDWSATREALQEMKNPIARRVTAAEAVFALAEGGMPINQAREQVREVVSDYVVVNY
jgi:hypothetical protein